MHAVGSEVQAGRLMATSDSSGRFGLLIPLLPDEAFADQAQGGTIGISRTRIAGISYAAVTCPSSELNDVFLIFVRDLMRSLPVSGPCSGAMVEHVGQWRQLFVEADAAGLLSLPQVVGLLAELQTLERILEFDSTRSLSVWSGPMKSQHDFRAKGAALEVKATLAREGYRTRISSVEQLNAPLGCSLHLSIFKYQVSPNGDSLPKVIRRIKLAGVNPLDFDKLLLRAGYRSGFEDIYGAYVLDVLAEQTFDVADEEFPKVVPGSFQGSHVPHGVEKLSYVIDLAGCLPKALDLEKRAYVYASLAEGHQHVGLDS